MPIIPVDTLNYHVNLMGAGSPVVLLHGFTGAGENWQNIATELGETHQVITVDLAGHGQTTASAQVKDYTIEQAAKALIHIFEALQLPPVHLLGYSMGGRLALYIALTYPAKLKSLILESASPGLESELARTTRREQDNALADRIEHEGIPAFVDFWENIPLFTSQKALPPSIRQRLREQRLKNNPAGLANSLRGIGTGVQPTLWGQLGKLALPVLILTGELDLKFTEIGQQMAAHLPNANHQSIAGVGHTLHLEKPDDYVVLVREFLLSGLM